MKLVSICLLVWVINIGSDYNSNIILLSNNSFYKKLWQFSGLTIYNNRIYMPAEKCSKLIVTDTNGIYKNIIFIDFSIIGVDSKNTELEGVAAYKNHLFITDESSKQHCLYSYNLSSKNLYKIESGDVLNKDIGEYGMEGIAIDSINNKCFVLKEKNGNKQSVIREFELIEKGDKITLRFIRNIYIAQPDFSWRYTDLYFNHIDKNLYCLKTKIGEYQIDTISIPLTIDDETIPIELNKKFMDISNTVNMYNKVGYHSNLEGLAIHNGNIYIVSDNAYTSDRNCDKPSEKKTLLLKIKK